MRVFKKWFNRFFLCLGMKIEFYCQLELNNNYLYSFGHKEKVDLFGSFTLKCERTSAFLIRLRPNWFSLCLDSDKKNLPLCYKHVIAMSFRKIWGKFHWLVFSEVCLKHLNVIYRLIFGYDFPSTHHPHTKYSPPTYPLY